MTKRTKELNVSPKVRKAVLSRQEFDGYPCCIIPKCGKPSRFLDMAHIISRAQGGRGVEENLVGLCREHHSDFDHGRPEVRNTLLRQIAEYMQNIYGENWNAEDYRYVREC